MHPIIMVHLILSLKTMVGRSPILALGMTLGDFNLEIPMGFGLRFWVGATKLFGFNALIPRNHPNYR
jgi:hypothetical protein